MNIADKAGLYREMARVVRVGGRLAFFDVLAGPNQPIHFPVPWASDPSFSFLLTAEETRALVVESGFREIAWMTGDALEAELDRPDPQADKPSSHPVLNPGLLNGPDGPQMGANVGRNSAEARILAALGVYERSDAGLPDEQQRRVAGGGITWVTSPTLGMC